MLEKVELKTTEVDDEAQKQITIKSLLALQRHPGWAIIKKALQYNVGVVNEQIFDENCPDDQSKLLKYVRIYLLNLIIYPNEQIKALGGTPEVADDPDPYYTSGELAAMHAGKK